MGRRNSTYRKEFTVVNRKIKLRKSGDRGFFQFACPSCGEAIGRSGVYVPRISRVWCWQKGCDLNKGKGKGIRIKDFMKSFKRGDFEKEVESAREWKGNELEFEEFTGIKEVVLPEKAKPIIEPGGMIREKAVKYLEGRGYNIEQLWDLYKIMYVDEVTEINNCFGYIVLPFMDKFQGIQYYQLRSFIPGKMRWKNPSKGTFGIGKSQVLFNEPRLLTTGPLDVFEGATDSMTCNAVGILGLVLSKTALYKLSASPCSEIYVALDSGAWADTLEHSLEIYRASKKPVYAVYLPEGDPNSLGEDAYLKYRSTHSFLINEVTYMEELERVKTIDFKTYRSASAAIKIW